MPFSDIFTVNLLFPPSFSIYFPPSSLVKASTTCISHFLLRSLVPFSFSSQLFPCPHWFLFTFPVTVLSPCNILIAKDLEKRTSDEREHVIFVCLGHLSQYDHFYFYPLAYKFMISFLFIDE